MSDLIDVSTIRLMSDEEREIEATKDYIANLQWELSATKQICNKLRDENANLREVVRFKDEIIGRYQRGILERVE